MGEVECDFAVIEGCLHASLVSREMATVGPSARVAGDVIYNVLELDRVSCRAVTSYRCTSYAKGVP